ncbi:MAG TPA: SCO family protein [Terriglobales bacterium]
MTLLCLAASTYAWAAQHYSASGLVLRVDHPSRTMIVSCDAIPGYMEAMAMPFSVLDSRELENLAPGTMIDFTLVVDKKSSRAENIKVRPFESFAQEPSQARRLTLLQKIMEPSSAVVQLTPGRRVPDFSLTDQNQRSVSLHDFAGKVVALDFVYTRCPLPDYCYRFSNNFGRLQKRFAGRLGRDLVLLTLTFDPVHDQPEKLATYAQTWKANPEVWHFLTGSPDDVRRVCSWFGVEFWSDEALLTHTLHTVIIDRQGNLVTNMEGNQYTAEQLGDLLETTMNGSKR